MLQEIIANKKTPTEMAGVFYLLFCFIHPPHSGILPNKDDS